MSMNVSTVSVNNLKQARVLDEKGRVCNAFSPCGTPYHKTNMGKIVGGGLALAGFIPVRISTKTMEKLPQEFQEEIKRCASMPKLYQFATATAVGLCMLGAGAIVDYFVNNSRAAKADLRSGKAQRYIIG